VNCTVSTLPVVPGNDVKKPTLAISLASLLVFAMSAQTSATQADQQSGNITDPAIFAQVNGVNLSSDIYAFLLQSREQEYAVEGAGPESEQANLSAQKSKAAKDLIMTTLLAQQAISTNMHETDRFKLELELFEQTLLAQLYVQQLMDNMTIDEALIRERYERQPQQTLYRFMIWETDNAELALSTLDALLNRSSPPAMNPQLTKIETPWLLGSEIDPEVQEKIALLGTNEFIESPVFQDGVWKVVQLIDKRALDRQSYEDERDILRAEIVSEKLEVSLASLLEQAQITVNEGLSTELSPR